MKRGEERQLHERTSSPDTLNWEHQVALPKDKGEIEGFIGERSCRVEPIARSTVTGRCLQSSQCNAKKGPREHSGASVPGRQSRDWVLGALRPERRLTS